MKGRVDAAWLLAEEVAAAARRRGARRTLLLDLDGTLAPIVRTPEDAAIPAATLDAIARLCDAGWRVAIVSGRSARDAQRLVPTRGVLIYGGHGREGPLTGPTSAADRALSRRLRTLARSAAALAATCPGVRVETKSLGLAFHDRLVPRFLVGPWRRRLAQWLEGVDCDELEVLFGKRVLELRPRDARKSRVADELGLPRRPSRLDASLVAIGDDVTDEDLFHRISAAGLAVRVGRPVLSTTANRRLRSPSGVRRFLRRLAELAAPPQPARKRSAGARTR